MLFSDYFKYKDKRAIISFEIFPPKTNKGMDNLKNELSELAQLRPDFITVTYGAMGTTREKTLDIASLIQNHFGVESACHLTCVGATKTELDILLQTIYDAGVRNIVALRGDPPEGKETFVQSEDGYSYGNELVEHIRNFEVRTGNKHHFGIAVAGYPEKHVEAPEIGADLANLKRKVDAGADVIITQLFFNNDFYFDFVKKVRDIGITVPIVPGIMPILSAKQIKRITTMCGTTIPEELKEKLDAAIDNDDKARDIGIAQCIRQSKDLLRRGVPGIHFYVLNKSRHMIRIMDALSENLDNHKITANTP
ncbi:MAG: methylenetetrahydrofolate reductase [NAD(P)H] [Candidatus Dadabacteria bacterium]|nr:methylenetetrahydrofolate reductase [NAD(P)H] [Candidatus Dadabacteria bacterium]